MPYILSGSAVALVLSIWSLVAWALHAVAVWTVSHADSLTGVTTSASSLPVPPWLSPWVPPELAQWISQVLIDMAPLVDRLLQAAPALSSGVTVAAWVIWGLGSVLIVMLGVGLTIVMARHRHRIGGRLFNTI